MTETKNPGFKLREKARANSGPKGTTGVIQTQDVSNSIWNQYRLSMQTFFFTKSEIAFVPGLFWHLHFLQDYSHPCQHQLSPFSLWVPSLPSKMEEEEEKEKKKELFCLISPGYGLQISI